MRSIFIFALILVGCSKPPASSSTRLLSDEKPPLVSTERAEPPLCENGVKAFESSVHQLVRKDCASCHSDDGLGPPHSVADVRKSYLRILSYVNWSDLDNSVFVRKGGSRHCLEHPGGACVSTHDDIKAVLKKWWEDGQKDCSEVGSVTSKAIFMPANLPTGKEFKKADWSLATVDPRLEGAHLEMEVQKLSDQRDGAGYYLFRKPRLYSPVPVSLSGLRFLVNGRLDPGADAFTFIRAKITPIKGASAGGTILSANYVNVAKETEEDAIALTFDTFTITETTKGCRNLKGFLADVAPVLQVRRCHSCHGGGKDELPGKAPGNVVFSMKLNEDLLCQSAMNRGDSRFLTEAPFITIPLRGSNGHPRMFISSDEVLPAWLEWLKSEREQTD